MSIAGWSWVAFVLSLGARYLNVQNKLVTYCNEAVLPFYIFHQTIILCVGWFVIRWNMGILSKYLIIAVISFILIIVLYEVLVRPLNLRRFLFGIATKEEAGRTACRTSGGDCDMIVNDRSELIATGFVATQSQLPYNHNCQS